MEPISRFDTPSSESQRWASIEPVLAFACGLIAANLYYAQPLIGLISGSLGLSAGTAGLIVTLTQLGYAAGLLFVVPLGDLIENRSLATGLIFLTSIALLGAALSPGPVSFLTAAFLIGCGSVAAQVLVTYAAHSAPEAVRGHSVGNVMGGLMLGIMLARPLSSELAELFSWHAAFLFSASLMFLLSFLIGALLPRRPMKSGLRYRALLASMLRLIKNTPVLRRRALGHACLFFSFSLFWTTVPLLLSSEAFGFTQGGIALFAVAGVAGAIAAPVAGRLADGKWARPAMAIVMLAVALSFLLAQISTSDAIGSTTSVVILVVAAIFLDTGVTMNLVISQRELFLLRAEERSRLNGLFMATFFTGGAAGSAIGAWLYSRNGWVFVCWIGFALPVLALTLYGIEHWGRRSRT